MFWSKHCVKWINLPSKLFLLHPLVLQQEMVEVKLICPTATEAMNVVPFAFSLAQTVFNRQNLSTTVKLKPNPEKQYNTKVTGLCMYSITLLFLTGIKIFFFFAVCNQIVCIFLNVRILNKERKWDVSKTNLKKFHQSSRWHNTDLSHTLLKMASHRMKSHTKNTAACELFNNNKNKRVYHLKEK